MLADTHISHLVDYPNENDCFPGVEIKGGVSFFLWDKNYIGDCNIKSMSGDDIVSEMTRPLSSYDVFIRHNQAISILEKVKILTSKYFSDKISSNDPFGFDRRIEGSYKRARFDFTKEQFKNSIQYYYNGFRKEGVGYIAKEQVTKNQTWIDKYKIFVPKAWGSGDPKSDQIKPFIVEPNSCCTETYLVIGPFDKIEEAQNTILYTQTKFFHFMLSLSKITQNTMQKAYQFVPDLDMNIEWTDEMLFAKYKLTSEEIGFITSIVKEM
jgi:hypothetical protein